jgi:L-fuconolactonase
MIIDTHTHIYDPQRPEGVPWPPSDNRTLYRTVLPSGTREVASPVGVTGTVIVEASTWIEDNDWVLHQADADTFVVGVVGWLDFTSPDFGPHIERLTHNRLFRGVRARQISIAELLQPQCLSNIRLLGERDLSLDILPQPGEIADFERICREAPDTRMIIDHIGHVRIDGKEPGAVWRRGMERVAGLPNVWCKASGFVEATKMQPAPTDLGFYRPTMDFLWNTFGEDRLVYGSNWPVCEMNASYERMFAVISGYLAEKSEAATAKVFSGNAKSLYKWVDRS